MSQMVDSTRPPRNNLFALLFVSVGSAFIFAVTFVIVMTLTLPPTDGAYGQAPFADPIVFPVMMVGVAITGAIAFPFVSLALRRKPLLKAVPIVWGIVLAELLLVTPLSSGIGLFGSFIAFAVALVLCRLTLRSLYWPGHCAQCGYDLRASKERCPECGTAIAAASAEAK